MSNLNSSFGELCILHELMSIKLSLVSESGGILLGTFLLGDWEEIKLNRDLHTLICWWKHSANEKGDTAYVSSARCMQLTCMMPLQPRML